MRVMLIIIIIMALGTVAYLGWKAASNIRKTYAPASSKTVLSQTDSANMPDTTTSNRHLKYAFHEITGKNISLGINLPTPKSGSNLYESLECEVLTNAGFYTPENKNLGLVIINGKQTSLRHSSRLLNGFVGIRSNQVHIAEELVFDSYDQVLQAGPLILKNNQYQDISMANNEPARRVVMAASADGKIYLIAMYDGNSAFMGPSFLEIRRLVESFEADQNVDLVDMINLDGGSASAFIAQNLQLNELKPIGSYFCVK